MECGSKSESYSDLDCSLSPSARHQADSAFGPHIINITALPFNMQADRAGRPLRFFSPFPFAQPFGTNVFAQDISPDGNEYVFPPFILIDLLLKFFSSQECTFSVLAPDLCPRKFWWPLIQRNAASAFKVSSKGDTNVLLFPARSRRPFLLSERPEQACKGPAASWYILDRFVSVPCFFTLKRFSRRLLNTKG